MEPAAGKEPPKATTGAGDSQSRVGEETPGTTGQQPPPPPPQEDHYIDDEEDVKETVPVMLATPDGRLPMAQWSFSSVSKLGGLPTVMKGNKTEVNFAKVMQSMNRTCGFCGATMYLLAQCFCPVQDGTNRMLYIFCCNKSSCCTRPAKDRTWAAYTVLVHEEDEEALNDEGGEEEDEEEEESPLSIPKNSFPPYALDVFDEPVVPVQATTSEIERKLIAQAEERKAKLERGEIDEHEAADMKEIATSIDLKDKEVDVNFEKFRLRIAREPTQVLRYGRGGKPLFMNQKIGRQTVVTAPPCALCGKPLQMELQVMPTALYYLHPDQHLPGADAGDGVDFATVTVLTCSGGPCSHVVTHSNIGCRGVFVQEEYVYVEPPPTADSEAPTESKKTLREALSCV